LITRALVPEPGQHCLSRVWANQGAGCFEALPPVDDDQRIDLALDLDLDGIVDLVTFDAASSLGLVRIYRGVAGNPPTFVRATFNGFARLVGNISAGNLHTNAFPDPGYPDLFMIGMYSGTQGVVSLNGFEPPASSWGSTSVSGSMPPTAHALVGDVNGDGLDDEVVGASGGAAARSVVRLKTGPSWAAFSGTVQLLPTGWLVDVDTDGDLDLLGDRIVFNLSAP
jgi:hypothetical protein